MKLLVVEGIIWFCHVDLLSRVLDAGHLVSHLCSLLDILRIGEVPIRPVSAVQGPADTIEPDRLISKFLRNLLRGKNYGRRTIAWGADV